MDGTRVLIIDDDESVRSAHVALLLRSGFEVDAVSDGAQGIGLALENSYELVLTDLGMPGITGGELVHRLRSIAPNARIAVLSGWSRNYVTDHFRNSTAGPDFILEKPLVSCHVIIDHLAGMSAIR